MVNRRHARPRVIHVAAVGQQPGEIPASAGIEVHEGIPGYTEIEPGKWQNESGGIVYGRYYAVTDVSQWNVDLCSQDSSGQWYCLEGAYSPVAPTTTTGNGSQPEPNNPPVAPIIQDQVKQPPATVADPVLVESTDTDKSNGSWIWLLLLALYLLSRKDKL